MFVEGLKSPSQVRIQDKLIYYYGAKTIRPCTYIWRNKMEAPKFGKEIVHNRFH